MNNRKDTGMITPKEMERLTYLSRKWATGRASEREIERCLALENKAKATAQATGGKLP